MCGTEVGELGMNGVTEGGVGWGGAGFTMASAFGWKGKMTGGGCGRR